MAYICTAGLNEIVPDTLLSIFDENELEVMDIHTHTHTHITSLRYARALSIAAPDVWHGYCVI